MPSKRKRNAKGKILPLSLDEIYYVERVVDKRVDKNVLQYLVKWKNYSPKHNTWEPIDHLKRYQCDELIDDYEQSVAITSKAGKRKSMDQNNSKSNKKVSLESQDDINDFSDMCTDSDDINGIDSEVTSDENAEQNDSDDDNDDDVISDDKTDETHSIEVSDVDEMVFDDKAVDEPLRVEETRAHEVRNDSIVSDQLVTEIIRTNGLRRGLKPLRILGVSDLTKDLCFIMSYDDTDIVDLVMSKEANIACPDVVIDFYQSIIVWKSKNDGNESDIENRALNA